MDIKVKTNRKRTNIKLMVFFLAFLLQPVEKVMHESTTDTIFYLFIYLIPLSFILKRILCRS